MPPQPTGNVFPDPLVVFSFGNEVFATDHTILAGRAPPAAVNDPDVSSRHSGKCGCVHAHTSLLACKRCALLRTGGVSLLHLIAVFTVRIGVGADTPIFSVIRALRAEAGDLQLAVDVAPPGSRKPRSFWGRTFSSMLMPVNSRCAHQVRPRAGWGGRPCVDASRLLGSNLTRVSVRE
jgi:hypothetical protein